MLRLPGRGRTRWRDEVAVVTGASSGLGRRLALDLATSGATVVGLARRSSLLDTLAEEMRRTSPNSSCRVVDVSDVEGYLRHLGEIEAEHGRIDLLLNVAGHGGLRRSEWPEMRPVRKVMEINFFAPYASLLAVVPGMRARGHGIVANVVSDDVRAPGPGPGDYEASKAALAAATESLSYVAGRDGVHLHVVYPAWMPTAMGRAAVSKGGVPVPPRAARRSEEHVSGVILRRLGGERIDINGAALPLLAPLARVVVPRLYHRLRPHF
ncbi:MAG: SDR family NAD(P)-dependent oxidoreductase [Acidimicrobiales bacterium]